MKKQNANKFPSNKNKLALAVGVLVTSSFGLAATVDSGGTVTIGHSVTNSGDGNIVIAGGTNPVTTTANSKSSILLLTSTANTKLTGNFNDSVVISSALTVANRKNVQSSNIIGYDNKINHTYKSVNLLGNGNESVGNTTDTLVIGNKNKVAQNNNIIIGNENDATGVQSTNVFIGRKIYMEAETTDAVALGNESVVRDPVSGTAFSTTNTTADETGYLSQPTDFQKEKGITELATHTLGTEAYAGHKDLDDLDEITFAGGTVKGIVSVGDSARESQTRRIQAVGAGLVTAQSTDAVNGSQLYALTRGFTVNVKDLASLAADEAATVVDKDKTLSRDETAEALGNSDKYKHDGKDARILTSSNLNFVAGNNVNIKFAGKNAANQAIVIDTKRDVDLDSITLQEKYDNNGAPITDLANNPAIKLTPTKGPSDLTNTQVDGQPVPNKEKPRIKIGAGSEEEYVATLNDGLIFTGDYSKALADAAAQALQAIQREENETDEAFEARKDAAVAGVLTNYATDTNNRVDRKLNQPLKIYGGAAADSLSDDNIGVVADDTNKALVVKLAKDLTKLNSITFDPATNGNKGGTIKNLAAGTKEKDAVNFGQLYTALGGNASTPFSFTVKNPGTGNNLLGDAVTDINGDKGNSGEATTNVAQALANVNAYINKGFTIHEGGATDEATPQNKRATITPGDKLVFSDGTNTKVKVTQEADGKTVVKVNVELTDPPKFKGVFETEAAKPADGAANPPADGEKPAVKPVPVKMQYTDDKTDVAKVNQVLGAAKDDAAVNAADLKAVNGVANHGFLVKTTADGGAVDNSKTYTIGTDETDDKTAENGYSNINPTKDVLELVAGENVKLIHETTDGGAKIKIETNNQAVVQSAQLPVVYTNKEGKKVYKVGDKFYTTPTPAEDAAPVDVADIIASMNTGGNQAAPMALDNIAGIYTTPRSEAGENTNVIPMKDRVLDGIKLDDVFSENNHVDVEKVVEDIDEAYKANPNKAVNVTDLKAVTEVANHGFVVTVDKNDEKGGIAEYTDGKKATNINPKTDLLKFVAGENVSLKHTRTAAGAEIEISAVLATPNFNPLTNAQGEEVQPNSIVDAIDTLHTKGTKYFKANSTRPAAAAVGVDSVAIGPNARATQPGSVAIGSDSVADEPAHVGPYSLNDKRVAGRTGTDTKVLSVGKKGDERQIQNVAPGVISDTSTDAVNGSQLHSVVQGVQANANAIRSLRQADKELRAGIAGANAMAHLPQVTEAGKSAVAIAAGSYDSQHAIAVGFSRISDNNKIIIKLSAGTNTQKKYNFGAGVAYQW